MKDLNESCLTLTQAYLQVQYLAQLAHRQPFATQLLAHLAPKNFQDVNFLQHGPLQIP